MKVILVFKTILGIFYCKFHTTKILKVACPVYKPQLGCRYFFSKNFYGIWTHSITYTVLYTVYNASS